ncbi:MAG TPA: hypothetical protein VJA82_13670 [Sediminibacterium sp.]|uniref:hypothetical protein n=1 Tax=Sediminibacterium sp. TaxID=1917865 RepID=UPI0008D7A179|nr:hypothetical protein [Sediminibacterium sp.]OHC86239.1 MAG: hypothetical protein A2472_01305 [Sphingobacteriia bacterium RIFOXYC2_FULL_35_18]OHC89752.1 MAG: hypothetical protein A2546_10550 [Sphingobacteriia bacterium RIFOXYD2_FULL_35_12]HLD54352.1 hypothetical protein [Sediminibacterium sp.]
MQYNNTVAILGANSAIGQMLANQIGGNYPLLLMDGSTENLTLLKQHILTTHPSAQVELIACSKDASWEADTIIIAAEASADQASIASKINEVTTCKTVIQIRYASADSVSIQPLLPYSKFVSVEWANTAAIVEGNDEVSLSITGEIVHLCGLKPIFKKSLI